MKIKTPEPKGKSLLTPVPLTNPEAVEEFFGKAKPEGLVETLDNATIEELEAALLKRKEEKLKLFQEKDEVVEAAKEKE